MVHGRITTLDGLRGWAALAVVFYHTLLAAGPDVAPGVMRSGLQEQAGAERVGLKLALSLCSGEIAVGVFFVLSGIVLMRALEAMHRQNASAVGTAWRFAVRRVLRIWPAMALCLVASVAVFPVAGWRALAENLALLRFPVNGATWTLQVEMAAVPLLLACFYGTRWLGSSLGRWVVPVLMAYALVAIRWKVLLGFSAELLTGFPYLLAGAAIAGGWYAPLCRPRWRGVAGWSALALLAAGILFAPGHLLLLRSMALLAAVPVLVAVVETMQGGRVAGFLRSPLSQALGVISFSLYLWNVLVFEAALAALGPRAPAHPLAAGLGVGAFAALVAWPIAVLSERFVEQPCIRLGRALTRPSAPTPP